MKRASPAPAKASERVVTATANEIAQGISLVMDTTRYPARYDLQHRASEEFSAQMLQLVNDPDFSDVVFLCSDDVRVVASRILLAGRSAAMKMMLMGSAGNLELSEIHMPDISSPVLLSVFEFLYTGVLSKFSAESRRTGWRRACELIKASRFFLLPHLEAIARESMFELTSIYTTKPEAAFMLTEAMGFKGLFDDGDDNLRALVILLSWKWSESHNLNTQHFVKKLSEGAFHYLLANTKGSCDDVFHDLLVNTKASCPNDDKLLIDEYLCFRQVIRWWVYQSEYGSDVEELLNYVTADEERALSISKNPNVMNEMAERHVEDGSRFSNAWSVLQSDEASRNAVIRLLSDIDFRRIHPVLLTMVVEPLKIVPSADVLSALRFHVVRRPLVLQKILDCGWKHGESYCTLLGGYSICKSTSKVGLAVIGAAVTSWSNGGYLNFGASGSKPSVPTRYYEWHFIVEETPKDICELGIIDSSELEAENASFDGDKLSDKLLSWAVNLAHKPSGTSESREWMMSRKTGAVSLDDETALKYKRVVLLQKGSRAVFTFDAFADRCSFKLDNSTEIVWKCIPVAKYHPAASFGRSSKGRVRIELVSGFDLLHP